MILIKQEIKKTGNLKQTRNQNKLTAAPLSSSAVAGMRLCLGALPLFVDVIVLGHFLEVMSEWIPDRAEIGSYQAHPECMLSMHHPKPMLLLLSKENQQGF